jgi:hypothetical protein
MTGMAADPAAISRSPATLGRFPTDLRVSPPSSNRQGTMSRQHRFLSLLAVPAVTLAACGGGDGDSDKDKLTKIINDGGTNPASICDHLDTALLKQIGGADGCKKAAASEKKDDTTKIDSLNVDGDKATAKVTDKSGATTISFVKQDGDWKVTATQ